MVWLCGCVVVTCDAKSHPYFTIEANVHLQHELLLSPEAPDGGLSLRHMFLFGPVATAIEAKQHNFLATPVVQSRMRKVWKGGDWCFKLVCVALCLLLIFDCWLMHRLAPPSHNLAGNLLSDKYERNISSYGEAFCLMTPLDHRILLRHVSQPRSFPDSPIFVFIFERVFDLWLAFLIFMTIFDTSEFIRDIRAFIDCGIPFGHGDEMSRCLSGLNNEVVNEASKSEFIYSRCVDASEWYMVRSLPSSKTTLSADHYIALISQILTSHWQQVGLTFAVILYEVGQLIEGGFLRYFQDYWNYVRATTQAYSYMRMV